MPVKTILLRGKQFTVRKELVAAAAITPGHLLERDVAGKAAVHSNAGKRAIAMFAFENELFGKGIDDAYAANDQVLIECPPRGAEVFALVAASAAAIVIGDFLESAGDGTLRITTTDAATDDTQRNSIIGVAIEAVDNSGGGSPARIKVELL